MVHRDALSSYRYRREALSSCRYRREALSRAIGTVKKRSSQQLYHRQTDMEKPTPWSKHTQYQSTPCESTEERASHFISKSRFWLLLLLQFIQNVLHQVLHDGLSFCRARGQELVPLASMPQCRRVSRRRRRISGSVVLVGVPGIAVVILDLRITVPG